MPLTNIVDRRAQIRAYDAEVLVQTTTNGQTDITKTDYLKITGNDTALATNIRSVTLTASNDDATVTAAVPVIAAQGGLHGVIIPQVAAPPTWAAWMKGMLLYNNTDNVLYIATNAAWVKVGLQT